MGNRLVLFGWKDFMLFDISYFQLKITLTALKRAELLSFLDSTLRGVIGQSDIAFGNSLCIRFL